MEGDLMKNSGIAAQAEAVINEVERVIIGKNDTVTLAVMTLLCNGHLLIEDIPGVGKTTLAKIIANDLGVDCKITSAPALDKKGDLAAGSGKTVDVNGKAVAVFNVEGTFYAIDDTCVHRGGPLGEGEVDGKIVACPWHGWRYDVTTGVNQMNPAVTVAKYAVKVEGDDVLVSV